MKRSGEKKGQNLATIKIKGTTQDDLKDLVNGLGASYDSTIRWLMDDKRQADENFVLTGIRLRDVFRDSRAGQDYNKAQQEAKEQRAKNSKRK